MDTKKFVTVDRLAAYIGLPVAWLKREAKQGHIPSIKAGKGLMFHVESVERVLCERAKSGTDGTGGEA